MREVFAVPAHTRASVSERTALYRLMERHGIKREGGDVGGDAGESEE